MRESAPRLGCAAPRFERMRRRRRVPRRRVSCQPTRVPDGRGGLMVTGGPEATAIVATGEGNYQPDGSRQ